MKLQSLINCQVHITILNALLFKIAEPSSRLFSGISTSEHLSYKNKRHNYSKAAVNRYVSITPQEINIV